MQCQSFIECSTFMSTKASEIFAHLPGHFSWHQKVLSIGYSCAHSKTSAFQILPVQVPTTFCIYVAICMYTHQLSCAMKQLSYINAVYGLGYHDSQCTYVSHNYLHI